MAQPILRFGRLVALAAVLAGLLAAVSLCDASAAVKPDGCPTGKPLVVNSYATVENTFDYGADGHIWALDAYTASIQIWRLGGNAYCVKVNSVGTSTTIAGLSPEGTGYVRAGVTASADGGWYERIYGKFAPTVATTGFIGNFDNQCQQDGTCAGAPPPSVEQLYFSPIRYVDYGAFTFTADASAVGCGTWFQSTSGDTGDIVC
ncbi:MAG: hypothetical protein ACXVRS_00240 [Gaiellaceae bacterium]